MTNPATLSLAHCVYHNFFVIKQVINSFPIMDFLLRIFWYVLQYDFFLLYINYSHYDTYKNMHDTQFAYRTKVSLFYTKHTSE